MREHLKNLKAQSLDICVGWHLHDDLDGFVKGFSQNLIEYYHKQLEDYGVQQFVGDSVDDLRNIADINGFKRVLVIKQGQVFPNFSQFMTDVSKAETGTVIFPSSFDGMLDFNNPDTDNMSKLIDMLNLQVSFVANTDNANLARRYMSADKNIKFTKLITSAGGLNPILYPFSLNFGAGTNVDVVDISNIALINAKRWVTEWDGHQQDVLSFVDKLIKSMSPSIHQEAFITRGARMKNDMQYLLDEQEGFDLWFDSEFPSIQYNYYKHDFFNSKDNEKLVRTIANNVGNVYIHLSNIFDYQATAFYYSLKTRVQLLNNFISLIKSNNLGKKVMIAYVDPQGQRKPTPMWVDDIETQDMLPKFQQFPWQ